MEPHNQKHYYASDPRFSMTIAGRLLVRILVPVWYTAMTIAGILLAYSATQSQQKAAGVFIVLITLDAFLHRGLADTSISRLLAKHASVNVASAVNPESFSVLEKALDTAIIRKTPLVLEIISAALSNARIRKAILRLDIDPTQLHQKIDEMKMRVVQDGHAQSTKEMQGVLEEIIEHALLFAQTYQHENITLSDVVSATFTREDEVVKKIKALFHIEASDIAMATILNETTNALTATIKGLFPLSAHGHVVRHAIMNRAWTSRPTPLLDSVSIDLTDSARSGYIGGMIGHEDEYIKLLDSLSRSGSASALLVGVPGIGKSTIVSHLAYAIVRNQVPTPLADKRVVEISASALVSAQDISIKLQTIIQEIMQAGNVIVYIPDMHELVSAAYAGTPLADVLVPHIENGSISCIAATTPEHYESYIQSRPEIAKAFEVIVVKEISVLQAQHYLMYEAASLEARSTIAISAVAVKQAATIAAGYLRQTPLPGSASAVIRQAFATAAQQGATFIHAPDIVKIVEEKSRIPIHQANEKEGKELLHLEDIIHTRYIDQEEAVRAVSDALRTYRSGLKMGDGPIASFLFVGPTGVGKTELAKILGEIQFGSVDALIRIDMSEYKTTQDVAKLIGGNGTQGTLAHAVAQKPFSVVLLDEFEKSNPEILDLFLQILSDGRVTTEYGKTIDFKNTIIIATSNAHSDIVTQGLQKGESMDQIAGYLREKLNDVFKIELLNRFSKIVIFKDLRPADLQQIVRLQMHAVQRTLQEKGIELLIDDDAVAELARRGYDPVYGVRPLQRVIQDEIIATLAKKILTHEIENADTVLVSAKAGQLQFIKRP